MIFSNNLITKPPNHHSVTILCMSFITEHFQLLKIGFQEMAIKKSPILTPELMFSECFESVLTANILFWCKKTSILQQRN